MRTHKLRDNKYEAIGTINEVSITLLGGIVIPVSFIAFGNTQSEAIHNFVKKVDDYLHPKPTSIYFSRELEEELTNNILN